MTTQQTNLWKSAAAAFDERHRLLRSEHRSLPTPCTDFDVAELVEHAVGTQIGIGRDLGGSAVDGASWDDARSAMATALDAPGALDGPIEHPALGTMPRTQLLAIATNDLLIHTWDLSRAIDVDATLPTQNLQPAIDGIEAFPPPARAALFGAPLDVADTASTQDRLLAVAGRQP